MPSSETRRWWCHACSWDGRTNEDCIHEEAAIIDRERPDRYVYFEVAIRLEGVVDFVRLPAAICEQHAEQVEACACGCGQLLANRAWQSYYHAVGEGMRGEDDRLGHIEFCNHCRARYAAHEPHGRCRPILNYSWRPPQGFTYHGGEWTGNDAVDPLFMGMELEVEIGRDLNPTAFADRLLDAFGELESPPSRVYIKSDGSINHGFEIVTMPHTHEALVTSDFLDIIDAYQEELACTDQMDTCGIHIHVNRSAFRTPAHLWRFLQLHNRNPTFVKAIAQRGSVQYASWDSTDDLFRNAEEVARNKNQPWGGNSHSTAINTGNAYTIELRYFRATVDPGLIRKNWDWVHAAWRYCDGEASPPLDSLSFLDWLAEHEADYQGLIMWAREHELLLDQAELPLVVEPTF